MKNYNFVSASDWLTMLRTNSSMLQQSLHHIYGNRDDAFLSYKNAELIRLVEHFISRFGDAPVCILRVPGRVNLMGRHVEHRGSCVNSFAIGRETLVAAAQRLDGRFSITNCRDEFGDYTFEIDSLIKQSESESWTAFLDSEIASDIVDRTKGEWINYVRSPLLRLKFEFPAHHLKGLNLCFNGDIPVAAGLSSSSSIVVATLAAQTILSPLHLSEDDFVRICGEGEWFVGSRGGWGDHAAMKCCKRDMITRFEFLPFRIGESERLPDDYCVICVNTFIQAKKSDGAKDKFNMKIACYEFGFMLLNEYFPAYKDRVRCLRDFSCGNLRVDEITLYRMLMRLPERISARQLMELMPVRAEEIQAILRTHTTPEHYLIRNTVFYGLAESARASMFLGLLRQRDYSEIGKLMNISHDGDRVMKNSSPFNNMISSEYLARMIDSMQNCESGLQPHIAYQPGAYGCSTEEIDDLVDFITAQDGVLGCELSGAGLGGSVLALVKNDYSGELLSKLKEHYYDKKGLPMGAEAVVPVQGCCVIDFPD